MTISSGTLNLGINSNTPAQLTSTNTVSLGGTINVISSGSQTLGLYTLISGSTVGGTFTPGTVPSGYKLIENVTPNTLDLQHLADQTVTALTINGQTSQTRVMTGQNLSVSATLNNTSPSSGASLNVTVGQAAGTALTVNSFTGTGPVAAAASTTIGGTLVTTTAATAQTWGLQNTDGSAITTVASATGTVDVINNRVVTATSLTGLNLLNNATGFGTVTLSTTGNDNQYTRVTVGSAGPDTNGVSVGTGSNPTFNSAAVTDSRFVSSSTAVTYGQVISSSNITLTTTGEGLVGESPINVNVNYSVAVVGNAYVGTHTPTTNLNNAASFGNVLTAAVLNGGSYDGLSSRTSPTNPSNGALSAAVGTEAIILKGTNNSGITQSVNMTWRDRADNETFSGRTVPPLSGASDIVISDVVKYSVSNPVATAINRNQTSTFALSMSYNPSLLIGIEANMAASGDIYLAWLNPVGSAIVDANYDPTSNSDRPLWQNAVAGNFGTGVDATGFQGGGSEIGGYGFSNFVTANSITDANLYQYLGDWGVDTTNHTAWVITNHDGQYGVVVVPEPTSLGLLGIGALGLLGRRRRKNRA